MDENAPCMVPLREGNAPGIPSPALTLYYGIGFIITQVFMLTIGGLAKRSGVSVQTLRYYERRTLLSSPKRTPSGYRQYPEDEVQRVEFIRRAQGLGFTLEEIGELLSLRVLPGGRCRGVEQAAQKTQRRVHERLEQLARLDHVDATHRGLQSGSSYRPLSDS